MEVRSINIVWDGERRSLLSQLQLQLRIAEYGLFWDSSSNQLTWHYKWNSFSVPTFFSHILELLILKRRISVAPASCKSSMIFDAPFFKTRDWTATVNQVRNTCEGGKWWARKVRSFIILPAPSSSWETVGDLFPGVIYKKKSKAFVSLSAANKTLQFCRAQ